MNTLIFLLIMLTVFLNAGAQLLLKHGMEKIGEFAFNADNVLPVAMQVAMTPSIVAGLFIYVVSVMSWLIVLSRADVSFAYPMTSIGYIVTAVAGFFLFHENLSLTRIVGIIVIMAGVYLITRS